MKTPTQATPLFLPKGAISVFTDAVATQVRCERGSLWLTQDNDPRDIVLKAGEQFQPDRRGNVLVYALEEAAFSWGPAAPAAVASPWHALATWLTAHFGRRVSAFAPGRHHAFE
jgi:hypothetical protein